jgi:hypothetical protein
VSIIRKRNTSKTIGLVIGFTAFTGTFVIGALLLAPARAQVPALPPLHPIKAPAPGWSPPPAVDLTGIDRTEDKGEKKESKPIQKVCQKPDDALDGERLQAKNVEELLDTVNEINIQVDALKQRQEKVIAVLREKLRKQGEKLAKLGLGAPEGSIEPKDAETKGTKECHSDDEKGATEDRMTGNKPIIP